MEEQGAGWLRMASGLGKCSFQFAKKLWREWDWCAERLSRGRNASVETFQGWRTWLHPKPIGWDTSVLDRSASHWRQFDARQTQPEAWRTSGDVLQWGRMECEGQDPDQSKKIKKSNNKRGASSTAVRKRKWSKCRMFSRKATGAWTQMQCNGRNMNAEQAGNGPLDGGGGHGNGKRELALPGTSLQGPGCWDRGEDDGRRWR